MKRPILIAVIGYIIGIIWGIYNKSIFPYCLGIIAIMYILKKFLNHRNKFRILSIKRYLRYVKLYFNKTSLILIIIMSFISNIVVLEFNKEYEEIYQTEGEIKFIGTIISSKMEKDYYNMYIIKIKNKNLYIYVDKKINLEYGDKISISGDYSKPEVQRNYKGFDYSKYLKSKNVYGIVKVTNVTLIEKNNCSKILKTVNKFHQILKDKIKENWKEDSKNIFIGMILGDTEEIDSTAIQSFKNSNISHILAISGMHISYIIIGVSFALNKIIGYRKSKIITIVSIIFYMLLAGTSPSMARASIMAILTIVSGLLHRKSDTLSNVSLSAFILLIYNPFVVFDLGFQFSYIGTLGIILFHKNIFNILKSIKNKSRKSILDNKLGKAISVILSAQILIFPISILNSGTFGIYFIITNLLSSLIIGPIIIIGLIYVIVLCINISIANFIGFNLNFLIQILMIISHIGNLPVGRIYLPTPNFISLLIYFFIIVLIQIKYLVYQFEIPKNQTIRRIRNIVALIKYKLKSKKKILKLIFITVIVIFIIHNFIPKNLRIHFVDVGQGDCTFIETPRNRTILIDGGGQINSNFDIGKSTLLPYILHRGYTSIDYIIISHFDFDHVGGLLYVMQEIKVKNVVISLKGQTDSENFKKFLEIAKENKINTITVKAGDKINIEKDVNFEVIWPIEGIDITENAINNAAICCKLNYKNFSCLFTGDIEKKAEEEILKKYKNQGVLKSNILKVGHHGSKTSSTEEFLSLVKPQISLIGVGKNNNFGHPNEEVLERLINCGSKIYRTDEDGEISITVDRKGRIKTNKFIE